MSRTDVLESSASPGLVTIRSAAIITARGGSKRIPRKNIRPFCGVPVISYAIRSALEAGCFDEVMVSTDDHEIAELARSFGAAVPFIRSAASSSDTATTASAIVEVLEEYGRREQHPDVACCIYPTTPLLTGETLAAGRQILEQSPDLTTLMAVTKYPHPVQRALRLHDGRIEAFAPESLLTRSQDLEAAYHDAGQFYWLRVQRFLQHPCLIGPSTGAIVLPAWQVQDIDTEEDWALAEAKYLLSRGKM
jgi:pseudaminic acid cytidylyltransferase